MAGQHGMDRKKRNFAQIGAGWVIRTPDLYITNVPLYQLS